jgi:hypothetical protein
MRFAHSILRRGALAIRSGCVGLVLSTAVVAGDLRVIELVDGSRISGEIVLFEHGVYSIESESLGRLHIPSSDIRAIRASHMGSSHQVAPSSVGSERPATMELSHYESQIVGDPAILAMVMALQNDPDVLAVLNDPSIMQAIAVRDYNALQNDPKILELGNNPTIRQILDIVAPK